MNWYQKNSEDICKELGTSLQGLDELKRNEYIEKYGKNVLREAKQESKFIKFVKHFNDLLIFVLIFSSILKIFLRDYIEAAIILTVVIINALIGYMQERKALQSLSGLSKMMSTNATILTDNHKEVIDASLLVPGDIVLVSPGQIIPADIRLIEAYELIVEEAILTGESEPVTKNSQVIEEEVDLGDTLNTLFSGSLVNSGSGVGVVIATGMDTELGKISENLNEVKPTDTPLIKKMKSLNKQIFFFIGFLTVLLFIFAAFFRGMDYVEIINALIALAISAVPEGLPAVLSIILSLGVTTMAHNQAIIKKMPAVETLGSMSVICSDKTGTLTKNEMKVLAIVNSQEVLAGQTQEEFQEQVEVRENEFSKILLVAQFCNDTKLSYHDGVKEVIGNPTEGALLEMTYHIPLTHKHQELYKIPFDSAYKYMAVLCDIDEERLILIKGAPDVVLKLAQYQMAVGGQTEIKRDYWEGQISNLAKEGKRVLAAAYRVVSKDTDSIHHDDLGEGLIFAGLYGIIDPPKPQAIEAVKICHDAGIQVKMITGDHKDTACAIAAEIGLKDPSNALTGKQIDLMSDEDLQDVVKTHNVFARTTPKHKLRLVTAIQENKHVVGMTGDGVNDAPALKKADIGIAMGIKGTQVTQDAGDMVLADDNFATIAKAVKEGRRVYDNLQKTIYFALPTAFAQGLLVVVSLIADIPLPLTAIQILWLNMVTTITLSFALGFEPASKDIMEKKPRDQKENILNKYAIFRTAYVSILIAALAFVIESYMQRQGMGEAYIQTTVIQTVVLAQVAYMISCRNIKGFAIDRNILKNKVLWLTLGALVILQVLSIYTPFFHTIMHTASIGIGAQGLAFLAGCIVFICVEVEKVLSKIIKK